MRVTRHPGPCPVQPSGIRTDRLPARSISVSGRCDLPAEAAARHERTARRVFVARSRPRSTSPSGHPPSEAKARRRAGALQQYHRLAGPIAVGQRKCLDTSHFRASSGLLRHLARVNIYSALVSGKCDTSPRPLYHPARSTSDLTHLV